MPITTTSLPARSRHDSFGPRHRRSASTAAPAPETRSPQTITEKIKQRYAVGLPEGKVVRSGDYIRLAPERCMTHDNTAAVMKKFMALGATDVHDLKQLVFTLDHDVSNTNPSNLQKYDNIEAFAR